MKVYLKVGNEDKVQKSKKFEFLFFFFLNLPINLVSLNWYDKKENVESLGLKKSPVAFISRVSFRGGEENKIKRREKVFPLLLISNKGKANERSRGNRDWNNYSIIKLRGNLRNDLWKWNRPRFGKCPRHQLNQEGLLFNYLGWRVGLVSPPCASVPDILSAAINEREKKKKKIQHQLKWARAGNRASSYRSKAGINR